MVNDKAPVLAAYALPLKPGHNVPIYHAVITHPVERVKLEAVRHHPRHGLLLLEAYSRQILAGVTFQNDGTPDFDFELKRRSPPPAALDAVAPVAIEYLVVEALAVVGDGIQMGVRGYVPAGKKGDLRALGALVGEAGETTLLGPLRHDGHAFGLSDAVCPPGLPDRCYLVWSYEDETGESRTDVAGLLTVSPLSGATIGTPRVCQSFAAKPEGIARFRDTLIVVFDNDARRKRPGDPSKFPIEVTQDFAQTLPLSDCPLR